MPDNVVKKGLQPQLNLFGIMMACQLDGVVTKSNWMVTDCLTVKSCTMSQL